MPNADPQGTYQKLVTEYRNKLAIASKLNDRIVLWRTLSFIAAAGLIVYGFTTEKLAYAAISLPLLVVFLWLVVNQQKVKEQIVYLNNIIGINETALDRLAWKWTGFSNTGQQFINPEHPYTTDLNIFGQGSLFQHIACTTSYRGDQALAGILDNQPGYQKIFQRQQAIQDLAGRLQWRQNFQALGMGKAVQRENPVKLIEWARGIPSNLINKKYLPLVWLLPAITISILILWAYNIAPLYLLLALLAVQSGIVVSTSKKVRRAFTPAERFAPELENYAALLKCIETEDFNAPLLLDLKDKLKSGKETASKQVKIFSGIADRIKLRYSFIHIVINILTLYDLYNFIKLEEWKGKNGLALKRWLDVIGEFEALSSLAGMAYDNPDWMYPEIVDGPPLFEATDLGHPLISRDARVPNDVSFPGPGTIFVITGSNMSGKSTYLRTIGINLILAYAGAPVCAGRMRCSVMNVYSSMQIHDNLEQRISTFYAELKRIKVIVDAAVAGQPVLVLLDEIFKGTNSRDRITGAKTVVKKLCSLSVLGLITTHDLELGVLEEECPRCVSNYHFTDEITGNQINFDYRLKPGLSQTTNAIALMRMVGIDLDDI